jgi:hypothetical protein
MVASFAVAAQRQARFAAFHRQQHDIAGIDQMRVLDLVLVESPDLRPLPGILQEFLRNIPERIALDHDMAVGRLSWRRISSARRTRCAANRTQDPKLHQNSVRMFLPFMMAAVSILIPHRYNSDVEKA